MAQDLPREELAAGYAEHEVAELLASGAAAGAAGAPQGAAFRV